MKKEKHSKGETALVSDGLDIKELMKENSAFFDNLIDLIPAKFYLPVEDGKVWFPGLKKGEKVAAKKESIDNTKKSRRDRMDPDKLSTTTLDLLKQSLRTSKKLIESEDEEENEEEINTASEHESVAYEDLQKRLRLKIEELKAARGSNSDRKTERADRRRAYEEKKRKRVSGGVSPYELEKDVVKAANELKFSQVRMGDEEQKSGKKRKISKEKELERAKELAASKDEKVSWNNAMSRAAGKKVHDNPKLLEKSYKKEKKLHQKNAKKWKERVDSQQKSKLEKQEVRTKNIQEKAKQKKMKKIQRREKKLLRPGFEGRKKGYINEA